MQEKLKQQLQLIGLSLLFLKLDLKSIFEDK